MWNAREAVEIFHLLFLHAFGTRVDKALYALKGGANLRFFHQSIRYSEDIDLDVRKISVATLRNHVDRSLTARPFIQALRAQRIELIKVSAPKQTDTTQRWKMQLAMGEGGAEAHTKIEFSRRGLDEGVAYSAVESRLMQHYRLYPVRAQHYIKETAFHQKINALAARAQTQARDVFDLKLLLDAGAGGKPLPKALSLLLPQAVESAMNVGYDDFAGQVLSYLAPEYQEDYRDRSVWEELQESVVDALRVLRP